MERIAGIDAIAGVGSHYSYERRLEELEASGCLPLSVVTGEFNRLKEINDS